MLGKCLGGITRTRTFPMSHHSSITLAQCPFMCAKISGNTSEVSVGRKTVDDMVKKKKKKGWGCGSFKSCSKYVIV